MIWFPPAKINLGLHVLRKRDDGFHDINTCFYPVSWVDMLEIIPSNKFSFTSSGLEIPGDGKDNLCVKAYQLLKADFDLPPVKIHLHKIIPMGAGLGGGSSDAAYTLKAINQLFELSLPLSRLHEYAAQLGSDCPFFLYDKPMIAKGKGDILKEVDLSLEEYKIIVVYPHIHVDTGKAYAEIKSFEEPAPLLDILKSEVPEWNGTLKNDFERTVFSEHPEIKGIKEKLYEVGAIYASLSGSGSAIYGIFEELPKKYDFSPHYKIFVST